MECLFGIVGKDFVVVAADTLAARSIVVMKSSEDKTRNLNNNVVIAYSGDPGDAVQFSEFIQANVRLYGVRNGVNLSTKEAAHFTRHELATSLRSRNPYQLNALIGGWDAKDGPELYWVDYLAAMNKVPFAAHGYGSYFCLSLLDRHYPVNSEDVTLEVALTLLRKCIQELKVRFIANIPSFVVKVIDKNGIRIVDLNEAA